MINWNLMKHPLNWVIVLMMLLIAAYGGHLLLKYFGASPSAPNSPQDTSNSDRNDISGFILQAANVDVSGM
jgi:hypothetical protein